MNNHPDCPFCLSNNTFTGDILAETDGGFATAARGFEHCYLLIPKDHVETLADIPDSWWVDFKQLTAKLTMPESYNLSLNYGKAAGQTLKHLHFWVIPRDAATPSATHGLATLINMVDEPAVPVE